jgi:phosphatidylserine/phosphatidylglycerophosphate/cardiolipin synthase-like enzyme
VSIRFYSAFIKQNAIEWLSEDIDNGVEVSVISRWRLADITEGVTDLSVYNYCKLKGWKFGIDQNLHAKTYIFDNTHVLLGSSNITKSAFGLSRNSNNEIGAAISPEISDLSKLADIENSAVWLNDELFKKIETYVTSILTEDAVSTSFEWPTDLMSEITKPINTLWVLDLPQMSTSRALKEFGNQSARSQFLSSRIYLWVIRELQAANDQYTNFGWLTAKLHDALIDDPKPFRKEVKEYVSYLFDWIECFGTDDIDVVKHNVTSSLHLKQ